MNSLSRLDEEEDERAGLLPKEMDKNDGSARSDSSEDDNGKSKGNQQVTLGGLTYTSLVIIVAEFAERCCYYAISAVYAIYMQAMLGFNASQINAATSSFNFAGYTFVLLGGYVADKSLGRRKTILVFGLIYLVGLLVLSLSASPLGYANFPYNPTWAIWGFILSLVLIALGMGGIKSNVGPLMADQLGPSASSDQLESAFRYFYWAINFGALLGMLLSPLIKRIGPTFPPLPSNATKLNEICASSSDPYTGYYVSFFVFTAIFVCGMVAFLWGYRSYISLPPHGSMLTRCMKLCLLARRERISAQAAWSQLPPGGRHWLDWSKKSCSPEDMPLVDDLKQTLKTLTVFTVQPIYWLLYLQMSNTLVLQASMMYLPDNITPDQMAALDPAFLVFLIPLFDTWIFPIMKSKGMRMNAIQRMTFGFMLAASSMLIAGGLQSGIYASGTFVDCSGVQTFVIGSGGGVNVFTQVPVYFFISVSEIFASITSLEFAYSEAPVRMKSIVMAYSLFQTAIGSLLGLALTPIVTEQNFMWLFLSFGIAMMVFAVIFYACFRNFHNPVDA